MINLIYGVTGQTGSYLADLLLGLNQIVIGVCRKPDDTKNIAHINNSNFSVIAGDIIDPIFVCNSIRKIKPDRIFNMAGQSSVGLSFGQPASTFESIAMGTLNILETMRVSNTKTRLVTASSSQIFGNSYTSRIIDNPAHPFYGQDKKYIFNTFLNSPKIDIPYSIIERYQDENTICKPVDPYGIAKLAALHLTRSYRDSYGVHASSAILFNHDSARRGPGFVTRKITDWINRFKHWNSDFPLEFDEHNIINGSNPVEKFPKLTLGNIYVSRDFGHAKDYARAMELMINEETPDDYVICTGKTYTLEHFLKISFQEIGIDNYTEFVRFDPGLIRPSNIEYTNGDNTKISSLGWSPEFSIEEIIKEMIHG